MKLYWINKCKDNNFRCYKCQNWLGNPDGQMPAASKNHRIHTIGGTVRCVVCDTVIGYIPNGTEYRGEKVKLGMAEKILENVEYVTAIEQKEF